MVERLDIEKNSRFEQIPEVEKTEQNIEKDSEKRESRESLENEKDIRQAKTQRKIQDTDEQIKQTSVSPATTPKSSTRTAIESILQEDLAIVYQGLDEEAKQEFKARGSETAAKIEVLVETMKAKAKTVLGLIKDWLKVIPGVNKYFLEQESKIKTDKIVAFAKKRKKELKNKI